MTKPSTLLAKRLSELLSERRALRALFPPYQLLLNARSYNAERTSLESQIAALVVGSLSLEEVEFVRLPQPRHIAECAYRLRTSFSTASLLDQPGLIWNAGPLPGVMTDNWHPSLKERLLDLCAPLDDTLERMLAE